MQFVSDPQQEIVGRFQLLALCVGNELALPQILEGTSAVLEISHPEQVLVIAQSATAIFDIRLLHVSRIAKLGPARFLVGNASGDVLVFMAADTFGQHDSFHPLEQVFVASHHPSLDQRRFGLHVRLGNSRTILDAADGVAHLQAHVP